MSCEENIDKATNTTIKQYMLDYRKEIKLKKLKGTIKRNYLKVDIQGEVASMKVIDIVVLQ